MATLKNLAFPGMTPGYMPKPVTPGTTMFPNGGAQTNNGLATGGAEPYWNSSPFASPVSSMGSTTINNGFGGNFGSSPGVTAGTYSGTGMGTPGSGALMANATNFRGDPTYGAGTKGWRSMWNGDVNALQGAAGKVNIWNMNMADQNQRDAEHRAATAARNAAIGAQPRTDPISGQGYMGTPYSQSYLESNFTPEQVQNIIQQSTPEWQAQNAASQQEVWANSLDPTRIEAKPLETWSPAQLQSGLTYYQQLQAAAVPGSNEWNMYQDRINSIQANLGGNRSPWAYPSQGNTASYWGNNAGTPPGGFPTGSGPRS